MRKLIPFTLVLPVLLLAGFVLAQDPTPSPGPVPPMVDEPLSKVMLAIGAVLVPFAVYSIRLVMPKIPRFVLPIVNMLVSTAATFVAGLVIPGMSFSLTKAAIVFVGAWVLREAATTLAEHGFA
jgi:hypothetical protein